MAKNSYKRLSVITKMDEILDFVTGCKAPVGVAETADAVGLPKGTTVCYLATLVDINYLQEFNNKYIGGDKLARYWARCKARVESQEAQLRERKQELGM